MPENQKSIKSRTSRKVYFPIYFMVFILLFAIVSIKVSGKEINKLALDLALVFSAILLVFVEIHRFRNLYELNEISLSHSVGILSRRTRRIDLGSISIADSQQTPWQRILNFGDVNAKMFSEDSSLTIKNINKPEEFANFLEEMMNKRGE